MKNVQIWSFGGLYFLVFELNTKIYEQGIANIYLIGFLQAQKLHIQSFHFVKVFSIWSFSGPYFVTFGVNTDIFSISPHSIQMRECFLIMLCLIKIPKMSTWTTKEQASKTVSLKTTIKTKSRID